MMRQAMKRMGIQQEVVEDAEEVLIRCSDREIVITNPQVSKVVMMGQVTYQVVGEVVERSLDTTPDISDEDIATVVEQTGCSEETAKRVLEETKGDLAESILKLKEDKKG